MYTRYHLDKEKNQIYFKGGLSYVKRKNITDCRTIRYSPGRRCLVLNDDRHNKKDFLFEINREVRQGLSPSCCNKE